MSQESKPPEGTLTPSTVSRPSLVEWCVFYTESLEADVLWPDEIERLSKLTMQFLGKRGSPP